MAPIQYARALQVVFWLLLRMAVLSTFLYYLMAWNTFLVMLKLTHPNCWTNVDELCQHHVQHFHGTILILQKETIHFPHIFPHCLCAVRFGVTIYNYQTENSYVSLSKKHPWSGYSSCLVSKIYAIINVVRQFFLCLGEGTAWLTKLWAHWFCCMW